MPQTLFDRILAVGTVVTIGAIVAMVVPNWDELSGRAATRPTTSSLPPAAPPPPAATSPAATTESDTEPEQALVITASRGASWLEVRTGNASGEELYYGTLAADETTSFDRLPLWVRLGDAGSVDLELNGEPVESLPATATGVIQFVVSSEGVSAAG